MAPETASRALDWVFRSPAQEITIEFQGGEPTLNWPLVEQVVLETMRLLRTPTDSTYAPASEVPTFMPSTSRRASALTPNATMTATEKIRPPPLHDEMIVLQANDKILHVMCGDLCQVA